jgi:hypothetical protein
MTTGTSGSGSSSSSSSTETSGGSTSSGAEVSPECGNGNLDPGEECDDGDDNDEHNACTGLCTLNVCGDGMRYDGVEACDLGNANTNGVQCGSCAAGSCTLGPHCGDGNLDIACGELCDLNETQNNLPCGPTCRFDEAKLVFITPDKYRGDLRVYTEREVDDGVDAADWICHELALEAHFIEPPADLDDPPEQPQFRAWLSSMKKPVEERLDTTHAGIYVERDGTVVAHGWAGLSSGALLSTITASPIPGQVVLNKPVWTNTRPDGAMNQPTLACIDWMTAESGTGAFGFSGSPNAWTYIEGMFGERPCYEEARLYCIEQ